jgi:hypothetical protein
MTPTQLERAARHYCKLMGVDPEMLVMTSPPPNPNGTVNAVAIYIPRWALVAQDLHSGWAMNEALKEGMRDQAPRLRIVHKDETYGDLVGKPGQIIPLKDGDRAIWVSDTTDA